MLGLPPAVDRTAIVTHIIVLGTFQEWPFEMPVIGRPNTVQGLLVRFDDSMGAFVAVTTIDDIPSVGVMSYLSDVRANLDATNFATEASFALAAEIWIMVGIAGQPKHGYAIMKDLQALGGFSMRPGTLYAALARMERARLVEEVQTRNYRRRPFRLTELGRARLAADLDTLARLASTGLQRLRLPPSERKGPPS